MEIRKSTLAQIVLCILLTSCQSAGQFDGHWGMYEPGWGYREFFQMDNEQCQNSVSKGFEKGTGGISISNDSIGFNANLKGEVGKLPLRFLDENAQFEVYSYQFEQKSMLLVKFNHSKATTCDGVQWDIDREKRLNQYDSLSKAYLGEPFLQQGITVE